VAIKNAHPQCFSYGLTSVERYSSAMEFTPMSLS